MSTVINRSTKEVRDGVTAASFDLADWIIGVDLSPVENVPVEYWKITGDVVSEMSQAEKEAVDAGIIPLEIAAKVEELRIATRDFIYTKYAPERQMTLAMLRTEARLDGKQDRAAYCGQVLGWIDACFTYFYTKAFEIMACQSRAAIAAVTWDFTALEAGDPDVSIYQARMINT